MNGIRRSSRIALSISPTSLIAAVTILAGALANARASAQEPGIYIMNADGTEPRLIASRENSWWQGWPQWSPDGKQLVFEAQANNAKGSDIRLYKVAAAGGELQDLGFGKSPSWSPDGKQIVFAMPTGNSTDPRGGLWTMNTDGTGREWMFGGRCPRYSPDGSRIASVNGREGIDTVYVYDVLEAAQKRILQENYQHITGCAWSLDSRQICFVGSRPDNATMELVIIDAEESGKPCKVRVAGNLGKCPNWAPASKILFWMSRDDGVQLHAVDPGTDDAPTALASQPGKQHNIDACWSPDGKRIAFSFNPTR
jgi:Tol biopolymer transport system component